MKIQICIVIFLLSLAGGVGSAAIGKLQPSHVDACGGYSCDEP